MLRPRFTPEVQVPGSTHPWALRDIFGMPYYCTAEVWRDVMTDSGYKAPWARVDDGDIRLGAGNVIRFANPTEAQAYATVLNERCLGFQETCDEETQKPAQPAPEGTQR